MLVSFNVVGLYSYVPLFSTILEFINNLEQAKMPATTSTEMYFILD